MAKWKIPGLVARPRFTSRATVLVLVICSLVAILAYPTRQFISQRSEIAAQRAKADNARRQVEQLGKERARWEDPAFVRTQARERLHYAMPGETPFISVDPKAPVTARPSSANSAPAPKAAAARPWYTGVWDSVDLADSAAAPAPAPAPR